MGSDREEDRSYSSGVQEFRSSGVQEYEFSHSPWKTVLLGRDLKQGMFQPPRSSKVTEQKNGPHTKIDIPGGAFPP